MSANQRGILAIVGCMASYTINDTLVKQIIRSYPIGEVIFIRGLMSAALIGTAAVIFGHAAELRRALNGRLATRSVFDGLSTACFIAALAHMRLADLAAVLQIAPLIITALSVIFYREIVGWRRWTAIGVGFVGALMVIKPTPSAFDVWALVGAGSALFAALREMLNRRIGHEVPTLVIAFWGALGISIFGGLFGAAEQWRMFAPYDFLMLLVASVFVAMAIFLMALGFRRVDLSVVAPFRYSYLITSAIAGYVVFNELPDRWSTAGALLIVASGLYALHREAVRRRNLTGEATPAA
jgi:drug/metabolite transporter (DMT)-like permease